MSGSEGNPDDVDRLQPSRFGLDIDDEFLDRITGNGVDDELVEKATTNPDELDDLLDDMVAESWDVPPTGEWWP